MSGSSFPIGAAGQAWGDEERATWAARAGVARRSYAEEVLAKLELLKDRFDIVQYGALSQDPARYPLFCIKTRGFDPGNGKPCVLVTGGVHGYETSGVQGALGFAATEMDSFMYSSSAKGIVSQALTGAGTEFKRLAEVI